MLGLVLAMIICVGLAVAVVVIVAMPARREGRDILAPRGEERGGEIVEPLPDGMDGSPAGFASAGDKSGELVEHQVD